MQPKDASMAVCQTIAAWTKCKPYSSSSILGDAFVYTHTVWMAWQVQFAKSSVSNHTRRILWLKCWSDELPCKKCFEWFPFEKRMPSWPLFGSVHLEITGGVRVISSRRKRPAPLPVDLLKLILGRVPFIPLSLSMPSLCKKKWPSKPAKTSAKASSVRWSTPASESWRMPVDHLVPGKISAA